MSSAEHEALVRRVYGYVAYRIGEGRDAERLTRDAFAAATAAGPLPAGADEALVRVLATARARILARAAPESPPAPGTELERALAELHGRDRDLVALRCGADLAPEAVAELLGLRRETVVTALERSLSQLYESLGPDFPLIRE